MKKTVVLTDDVKNDDGQRFASLRVVLEGDGSTPNIMAVGTGVPIGYNDDGTAILAEHDNAALKKSQQEMMAEAIKVQKNLTKENGGDPSKVNVINAETNTSTKPTAREVLTATMMKDIASLKMQVAQLKKEETK